MMTNGRNHHVPNVDDGAVDDPVVPAPEDIFSLLFSYQPPQSPPSNDNAFASFILESTQLPPSAPARAVFVVDATALDHTMARASTTTDSQVDSTVSDYINALDAESQEVYKTCLMEFQRRFVNDHKKAQEEGRPVQVFSPPPLTDWSQATTPRPQRRGISPAFLASPPGNNKLIQLFIPWIKIKKNPLM
jgi:hypothetical protein